MGTKNYRYSAFTLVELLISFAILAILALAAIMYFRGQAFKGNDARRKADIQRIKVAVEEYEKDRNCYPQYVVCGIDQSQPIYPYLNNVPCDPATNASYVYDYQDTQCPSWYRFYAKLEFSGDLDIISNIGPDGAFNYVTGSSNAPVSTPGTAPTPTPDTSHGQFYGCRLGVCVPINWNPERPGPECDPSFQNSNCYGQCGPPHLECVTVN